MTGDPIDRARAFFGGDEPPGDGRHGRYRLVRELGRGGMAVVHEAIDPDLGRAVALKVLREGTSERLRREAMAAARLEHPNVVRIYEVGPDYIAMELVRGRTLARALPELPRAERLRILEVVARAVGDAHAAGIVHRDIKPENVLVEEGGRVVLTDFGLARIPEQSDLTRSGAVLGTPHYMAPEQVRGEVRRIGPAADVWALGVLIHELAAGSRPFDGPTIPAIYDRIVRGEPPPLPGPLGAIAAKALEKDPARRYPDARALAADLGRLARGEPVEARPVGPLRRLGRRIGRAPLPFALGAAAVLAAAAAAALAVRSGRDGDRVVAALREQARVSVEAALALRRAGAVERMRQFLPPLEAAYREALARAPELAEVEHLMGRMHRALLDDERALAFQERALAKDPGFAPARHERALLLSLRHLRRARGEEPASGDEIAARALADWEAVLDEPRARGLDEAAARLGRGLRAYLRGEPAAARVEIEAAVKSDPALEEGFEALAHVVEADRRPNAEVQERRFAEAERMLADRIERDRGYLPHLLARGQLRFARGSGRRHRGIDPLPDYGAAAEDFSRGIALDQRAVAFWAWRGRVAVYRGIWRLERQEDPRPDLAAAEEDLSRALALDRQHAPAWLWRGNARFFRATHLAALGADPLPDFAAAEKDLGEAVRLGGATHDAPMWRGRMRAQHAAALARAGRDPAPTFDAAEEDFAVAAARAPADMWLWMWRSTVPTERALWRIARREDPEPDFATARAHLDRALSLQRNQMEVWRHRGLLVHHRARHLDRAGRRADARRAYAEAAADLLQAIALNPVLEGHVGPWLREAQRRARELE